jgi:hypothetical protein
MHSKRDKKCVEFRVLAKLMAPLGDPMKVSDSFSTDGVGVT